jgi:predicted ATPase/DNA-binding SARP family transcriptional activator/Tfp pilus assembly protein PilF
MANVWQIRLFRNLEVTWGERTLYIKEGNAGYVLAYLAFYRDGPHARDEIARIYWPDATSKAARDNLRAALAYLNRKLKEQALPNLSDLLTYDGNDFLRIREDAVIDVAVFRAAYWSFKHASTDVLRREHLAKAEELYRGPLLIEYDHAWVDNERTILAVEYIEMLERLIALCISASNLDMARTYALRIAQASDDKIDACTRLMEIEQAAGRPDKVIQWYQKLESLYYSEFGEEPPRRIQEMFNRARAERRRESQTLSSEQGTPAGSARTTPTAGRPALAFSNLPIPQSRFCGREKEIKDLVIRLRPEQDSIPERLITLTGPGGVGKTSLALEVARRLRTDYEDRVYFISLVDTHDQQGVLERVANTLLPRGKKQCRLDHLVQQFRPFVGLLVLDNFDHLVEVGAAVIKELRQSLPTLSLLITSRQPLQLEEEQAIPVLPLPTPAAIMDTVSLQEFASVQMFLDCARRLDPMFVLTSVNADLIAAICRRLEGYPIALKLAAAWVKMLTLIQIKERLTARFDLLVSPYQDVPERQKSLWMALYTSYALLSPFQQQVLAHLSVFRDGWTLEAAEAICADIKSEQQQPRNRRSFAVLSALRELQTHSMINSEEINGTMHYRMLETIREFAEECLSAAQRSALTQRHAQYFLTSVAQAQTHLTGAQEEEWLDRIEIDHANLCAALEALLPDDQSQVTRDLTDCLGYFWLTRGRLSESRGILNRLLSAARHPVARARVLNIVGSFAGIQSDFSEAERAHLECLELAAAANDLRAKATALNNLGLLAWNQLDYAAARSYYAASLPLDLQLNRPRNVLITRLNLSLVACREGNFTEARVLLTQNLDQARELNDLHGRSWTLCNLGYLARLEGDLGQAKNLCRESLAILATFKDEVAMAAVLEEVAYIANERGEMRDCLRLLGIANKVRQKYDAPLAPVERIYYDACLLVAGKKLSADIIQDLLDRGRAEDLEDTVNAILGDLTNS